MADITSAAGGNAKAFAAPEDDPLHNFHLLDSESQERLIRLKSHYDNLLPMEKRAFVEMLGLPIDERVIAALFETQDKTYANKLYHSDRYNAVRLRDTSYAMLRQGQPQPQLGYRPDLSKPSPITREAAAADAFAVSDAELRGLLTPALFGQGEVPLRVQKQALYERVGMLQDDEANPAAAFETGVPTTTTAASEEKEGQEARAPSGEAVPPGGQEEKPFKRFSIALDQSNAPPAIYRSNGYQALRLGYSFPVKLNLTRQAETEEACVEVINLSGIPINRDQLREWFNSLGPRRIPNEEEEEKGIEGDEPEDIEHDSSLEDDSVVDNDYYLDLKAFLEYMLSLDRGFGATDTYVQLQKDAVALSKDGDKLGFPAFSYLMMRFVRA